MSTCTLTTQKYLKTGVPFSERSTTVVIGLYGHRREVSDKKTVNSFSDTEMAMVVHTRVH